jgi:hypothetical protein
VRDPRQIGSQIFCDPVRQILLVGVVAEIRPSRVPSV